MNWQLKDYKAIDGSGAVAGRFTVSIGPMEIRGWAHFCGENGSEWVSGPVREFEKGGERKFYNFIFFPDRERWSSFQEWALEEIRKIAPAKSRQPVDDPDSDMPF